MKDFFGSSFKFIGVLLILCGAYLIFQTEFVVSVKDGIMYDGLGQELNETGKQKVNKYVLPTYLCIGGGIALLNVNSNKKDRK